MKNMIIAISLVATGFVFASTERKSSREGQSPPADCACVTCFMRGNGCDGNKFNDPRTVVQKNAGQAKRATQKPASAITQ